MMKNKAYMVSGKTAGVFLLIAFLVAPSLAASIKGAEPRIRDLLVVEKKGQLLVFASLDSGFSQDLSEAIRSGVTTRFVFELNLMRARRVIYDADVLTQNVVHQVKYDALKKAYTFTLFRGEPDKNLRRVTRRHDEMVDWMAELNGEPIANVRELPKEGKYYLRARATLNTVNFSFPFNYLLSFMGRKTGWALSPAFSINGA
ncbi:MAG: DUF4390 domain-containing protein [bacterium]|nr:DUF4390 domain-containing protein [bacterium]